MRRKDREQAYAGGEQFLLRRDIYGPVYDGDASSERIQVMYNLDGVGGRNMKKKIRRQMNWFNDESPIRKMYEFVEQRELHCRDPRFHNIIMFHSDNNSKKHVTPGNFAHTEILGTATGGTFNSLCANIYIIPEAKILDVLNFAVRHEVMHLWLKHPHFYRGDTYDPPYTDDHSFKSIMSYEQGERYRECLEGADVEEAKVCDGRYADPSKDDVTAVRMQYEKSLEKTRAFLRGGSNEVERGVDGESRERGSYKVNPDGSFVELNGDGFGMSPDFALFEGRGVSSLPCSFGNSTVVSAPELSSSERPGRDTVLGTVALAAVASYGLSRLWDCMRTRRKGGHADRVVTDRLDAASSVSLSF